MKQTGLWSRLNRRYRAALRERMGEHGAAMMLAILFVMVVLTTSALVMTTLLPRRFLTRTIRKTPKPTMRPNPALKSA